MITDHFEQANTLARAARPREALQLYKQYLAVAPHDHFGWFNAATMHEQVGEWEQAYEAWSEALKREAPQKALVYFQQGICAFQAGRNLAEAEKDKWFKASYQAFVLAKLHGAKIQPQIQQFLDRAPTSWREGGL